MHILLCHERFLFRYGADRVLILLGKGLRAMGHTVTVMANRYDREVVETFASRVVDVPDKDIAYNDLNEYTAGWLEDHWERLFPGGSAPEAALVGGWPFFSSIGFLRRACGQAIFIDFGAVPVDGYPEEVQGTLEKLRALRRRHLPEASLVVGISDFIARSQSNVDAQGRAPVRSVLLGADHLQMRIWPQPSGDGGALERVEALRRQGKRLILCLGRWEPGCYKNSQVALEVLGRLPEDCLLLALERPENVPPPAVALGFPGDDELAAIMQRVDLGISVSLWEGFNLPLAEMQWLGRPALAFNLAAHPEVIAHPWYLCGDTAEMAAKAGEILRGGGPPAEVRQGALETFRRKFTWQRFLDEYARMLETMAPQSVLIIDVTNSARDPGNSGVIRVTRRFSRAVQRSQDPIFVVWDAAGSRYVLPTRAEYEQLGKFQGPLLKDEQWLSRSAETRTSLDDFLRVHGFSGSWLLLPETLFELVFRDIRAYARQRGLRIAAIFYDAIPVLRPELCNEAIRDNHRAYMRGLAACDLVIPISEFSAECLRSFWTEDGVDIGCQVRADVLPGEYGDAPRPAALPAASEEIRILCVSTLEPRKNHRNLIHACLLAGERHPQLNWSLTLVGNRYDGAAELAEFVERATAANPRIRWLGVVDDEALNRLYEAASFTVYPSVIEGFGLPIVESVWHGRPCICSENGVMAELAAEGGCLTVDVEDVERMAEAIGQLATDGALRVKLAAQARARRFKTWDDYATELLGMLRERREPAPAAAPRWEDILYPQCLLDNWQMHDAERVALAGVLARHRPRCSIEVGTYCGGSLSLLAQYSSAVFSIDIDPGVRARFAHFENVSFLTGDSGLILPHLLRELDEAGLPADFILIDGDHSAAGVRRDLAAALAYAPKRPLFVMIHDSFNPECRRGMLEAEWRASPYCQFVDLDFVPGRVIQPSGPMQGQMWGGLALAYFSPVPRREELSFNASADAMFRAIKLWSEVQDYAAWPGT